MFGGAELHLRPNRWMVDDGSPAGAAAVVALIHKLLYCARSEGRGTVVMVPLTTVQFQVHEHAGWRPIPVACLCNSVLDTTMGEVRYEGNPSDAQP